MHRSEAERVAAVATRATVENRSSRDADQDFAAASVAMCAALLDDADAAAMTSDELRTQASLFRTIAAFAIRGSLRCEERASMLSTQRSAA